jgi:signal transduction histidine kinase
MDAQETTLFTAILIAGIVIGTIILFFVISIVRQQRRHLALSRKAILAELTAMEKERSRIAQDLHDDLGPILSVVKYKVDSITPLHEADAQQLASVSGHLDGLIERLQAIARNLVPSVLIRKGLLPSIEEFVEGVSAAGHVQVVFTHSHPFPTISEERSLHLYRLLQEAVHNSLKHAHPTRIEIHLKIKNGSLTLLCRDNGVGFDYKKALHESPGLGLRSLRGRVKMMGGRLQAESAKGKGTAYLFTFPL